MRPPTSRSIVALVGAIVLGACSPVSQASPGISTEPSTLPSAGPTATAAPERTPVPGFADWQLINPGAVRISLDDKTLVMDLTASVIWFNGDKGVLFYREVTGDFRATATVRTARSSDASAAPGQDGTVQLAGLMARTEVPAENYVFIATGSIGASTGLETKTTESSHSIWIQRAQPTGGDAELRVCRIGTTFFLWWRHVDTNEDWTHMSTLDREDIPETVQVGANIYTDASPDIVARFEHLTIEPIPAGAGC
jgi:hypothetical protein